MVIGMYLASYLADTGIEVKLFEGFMLMYLTDLKSVLLGAMVVWFPPFGDFQLVWIIGLIMIDEGAPQLLDIPGLH